MAEEETTGDCDCAWQRRSAQSDENQLHPIPFCLGRTTTSTTTYVVENFNPNNNKSVINYTYDTQAFTRAWQKACSTKGRVILVVPKEKKYHLKPIKFGGPCQFEQLNFEILGTIVASNEQSDYGEYGSRWLIFDNVKNLLVQGGGTLDGYGDIWWNKPCKMNKSQLCKQAPTAITFHNCENLVVRNLKVRNAQQTHISFNHCRNVKASHLTISASENSPSTNGIYVSHTEDINISHSVIGTGADCISIKSGTKKVRASDITCGPGYGISIGDLGSGNSEAHVTDVIVDRANFYETKFGVRIKTVQGGSGSASNIRFKNIQMNNVENPIVIEQNYCDQSKKLCKQQGSSSSAVQVSKVSFENIKGTSVTKEAIKLDCSESFPCKDIKMENVHFTYYKNQGHTKAVCQNVEFTRFRDIIPSCDSDTIDHRKPQPQTQPKPQLKPQPQPPQPKPQPKPKPRSQPKPRPVPVQKRGVINVDDFGAKGRGQDDTMAFEKAWQKACSSNVPIVLVVPSQNTYLVKPIVFRGPCKSKVTVQIDGTIEAPSDPSDYNGHESNWLMFENINDLVVQGGGTINGNGNSWWKLSCNIDTSLPCKPAPTGLTFSNCNNLVVRDLHVKDCQQMQVMFVNCNTVMAFNLTVTAPGDSPNTDGIHVTRCENVDISNSVIGTGDDCISIVSGSRNVTATDITCGPGHGISIGSLGAGHAEAHVSDIFVRRAKFYETTNGVRIKTWQGGRGDARNIKFQDIEMHNVQNPIIIDQNYCDRRRMVCKQEESTVQVSDVLYQNIKGTSATQVAIMFDCSQSHECENIILQDVELQLPQHRAHAEALCNNVDLTHIGRVTPLCPN
ncbi:uncharacterized protein LOC115711203 isoform X3 [Cannabis sativa]|uniref:uncharacterized protein LOC115711203 isoform X3 n=1 Tax=Cannabis sativa TaxID=3483 RepID=UPI0029C9DBDE|nr:uncharacterized protein LOC115711203 isoform X3 [Cannabis sativa]